MVDSFRAERQLERALFHGLGEPPRDDWNMNSLERQGEFPYPAVNIKPEQKVFWQSSENFVQVNESTFRRRIIRERG